MQTLREGALRYVTGTVNHEENPEQFQSELELQLDKHVQRKQQKSLLKLKHQLTKGQLCKQDVEARAVLQAHIALKINKAAAKRAANRQQSVMDRAPQRKIREQIREHQIIKRSAGLRQSLKKIEEIEARYVASESASLSLKGNRSEEVLRKRGEQDWRGVERATSKQAIQKPSRQLSNLFVSRVNHHREVELEKYQKQITKLGESMLRIEEARRKKQLFMKEKGQKMRQAAELEKQLRQERLKSQRMGEMREEMRQVQRKPVDEQELKRVWSVNCTYRYKIRRAIEEYFRVGK